MDPKPKTKKEKEHATQYLSHNVVGAPLTDIPLDLISSVTMHVILGLTRLFSKIEELEVEQTIGNVTYQFHQGVIEARDNARKYIDHLKIEFKDEIDTMEDKRTETAKIVKEIEKVCGKIATVRCGQ